MSKYTKKKNKSLRSENKKIRQDLAASQNIARNIQVAHQQITKEQQAQIEKLESDLQKERSAYARYRRMMDVQFKLLGDELARYKNNWLVRLLVR